MALGKSILKRINAAAESSLSGTIGKKARIYPAASLFNESERAFNRKIAEILEACGYEVFLPQREGGCVPHPQEVEDGGWTAPENAGITDGLAEVFDKATADIEDFEYVPVGLIESQIVAGYTYRFLCKAPEDNTETEPRSAVVEIFVDLEGNAKVVNIMEVESRSM